MHDHDPLANRSATAVRRSPARMAAGAGAALVVVLAAVWGVATRDEPAARATTAGDHGSGRGEAADVPAPQGAADLPEGREPTPFDTQYPAVGRLDKGLLKAVQEAARDAREDGIEFRVTSGWRSREHQQRLLNEAVRRYGSAEEARRFVNTPDKSAHVSGRAVDIGPTDADDWLIRHGDDYGLCQVYNNEMWHFELLTAPGGACPAPLTDAAG
ncbi:M15 family metallopeptidase [Streptomyces sp. NPDC014872]|uniref:M15 family metallopeptidase n=1 Tax=Streptomyces sp. NPDC014872 TaxID=3364926 RepID=UPI003701382D